ncbi:MAG TPA: AmmeMemoRadiSam system protein B [Thermoplasmata archaeon]|nr:AmmeMemoRadiSam system protein B [Thermoplasmata archaeon]
MRRPAVAGQFYPGRKEALIKAIEDSFKRGFGKIPVPTKESEKKEFVGVVVPHAGYIFSGPTASYSYAYLLENGFPETILLLGPLHHPLPDGVYLSLDDFATPLGIVKNERELGELLMKNWSPISRSEKAHNYEHSLEVQLPFLQHTAPFEFTIVPIGFSYHNIKTAKKVASHISSVMEDYGKRVGVVASSDFSHVGFSYGYTPVVGSGETVVSWMKKHDGKAIDYITALDTEGFFSFKNKLGLTICGAGPIMTLMEIAKEVGVEKGEKLFYDTSYTVSKNSDMIVGYGSIGFKY